MNSFAYWDSRFAEDWESFQGPAQSRFFARLTIENLPHWFIEQLQRQPLTLCDWGCAQGDGTDVWASYVDSERLTGVDFSSIAIEQATQRYPAIRFLNEDWLAGQPDEQSVFDVVFSSNTLEHFHKPYSVLKSLCRRARKALVLALPYRELDRHQEHFYTFLPDNIPSVVDGGFRLVWSRVVNCRQLPNTFWGGDQIILVYAEPSWIDGQGLTLQDFGIEQNDSAAEITNLNQAVVDREGQIASLNEAVTDRDGQIASLNQAVIEKDGQISRLNNDVTEIRSSTSWRITAPLRTVKRLILATTREDARYALLKSIYWRLPERWRLLLNKPRHEFAAKRLRARGENLVASGQLSLDDAKLMMPWVARALAEKKIAVIPCAFEFDELVNQRPINAAKYYSEKGFLVLYVAWQWTPEERLSKGTGEVFPNVIQVPLYEFLKGFESLSLGEKIAHYIITLPARHFTKTVDAWRSNGGIVIYDIMDDWEGFHKAGQAPWYEKNLEQELVLKADFVIAVSPRLQLKFQHIRTDIAVIGNGYNPSTLGLTNKGIAGKRCEDCVVIGYFGHLTDAWFDWDLLFSVASQFADYQFEIIGYGEPEWVRRKTSQFGNISLVGKVSPAILHTYVSRWSIAIIPFIQSDLSDAVDPIKIYEYLYFGLPVVVTGIGHLKYYPKTHFATSLTIQEAITQALADTITEDSLEVFLSETTWEARFDSLMNLASTNKGLFALYEH